MSYLIRGEDYAARFPSFELIDRGLEMEELISILSRKRSNSVLMTGPSGVGISALCIGLQAMKSAPGASIDIVAMRLFWLDTNGLFSSGDGAQINTEFQRVLKTLEHTPNSILIIEDARDFIDACRNTNTMHFINGLVASIRDGKTKAIIEAGDTDLDIVVKSHSDFVELFTMMDVKEPVGDALVAIVKSAALKLIEHHQFKIADDVVETTIGLSTKYRAFSTRAQPEKSITLLDRAMSSYRKIVHSTISTEHGAELKKLTDLLWQGEGQLLKMDDEIRGEIDAEKKRRAGAPEKKSAMAVIAGIETKTVTDLRGRRKKFSDEAAKIQTQFDELVGKVNADVLMDSNAVITEFSKITKIPASKLNENEVEKLVSLNGRLRERVFGQDNAISRVANGIKVARVGRRNKDKPQAVYMFIGPSGVGKTEMAKALAQTLTDDEKNLFRFDMSEYMEKHAVAKMIGAPPGYEGFEAGGILTNGMRRNPVQILLFDEIEKAHPDVFNIFLQILGDGRLTDNVGRTVSFSESIIIMTSNIGQSHFINEKLTESEARDRAMDELRSTYRPEFLNRFAGGENIICFYKLDLGSIESIVKREIGDIKSAYTKVSLDIDEYAITQFCKDRYEPKVGARGLPGIIQSQLEPKIADLILSGVIDTTLNVKYDLKKREFVVKMMGGI